MSKNLKHVVSTKLNSISNFIGQSQIRALLEISNTEEFDHILNIIENLSKTISDAPKIYEQDGKGDDAVAFLHYFGPSSDFYILEKDTSNKQHQAFGLSYIRGYDPELGYISINELLKNNIELDLYFKPKTIHDIKDEILGNDLSP